MISIRQLTALQTLPIRHQVMYPEKQIEEMILPEDQEGEHFGVYEDEQLVSVVSLFISGASAQFRKLATMEEKQGRGYGRSLLDHVLKYTAEKGVKKLWCNARANKISFYSKAGFYETDQTFSRDGYNFVIMKKDLGL